MLKKRASKSTQMVAEASNIPTQYSFIKPKEGATPCSKRVKEWKKKNKLEVNKTERIRKERLSKFINELRDLLEKESGTVLGSKETVIKSAIDRIISLKAEVSTLVKNGTSERVSQEMELIRKRNKTLEEEKKRYIEILKTNALPTNVSVADHQCRKQPKRKIQRLIAAAGPCKKKQMKSLSGSSVMVVEPTKDHPKPQQLLDKEQQELLLTNSVLTEIRKENLEIPATTNPIVTVMSSHPPQHYPTLPKPTTTHSMAISKNHQDQNRWIEKPLDPPALNRPEATKNCDTISQLSSSALQLPSISRLFRSESQQQIVDDPPQPPSTSLQSWLNPSAHGEQTSENSNNNNHHQQRGLSKSLSFTIDGLMQDQQSSVTRCQRSNIQALPPLHHPVAEHQLLPKTTSPTGNVDRVSKTLWQPAIDNNYTAHHNSTRPLHYPKSGEDAIIRKAPLSSYVPQPTPLLHSNQNPWINSSCSRQVYNQSYTETTTGCCSSFQQSPEGSSNPYWLSTPHHYKPSLESPTYHPPDCESSKPPPVTPSFWSNSSSSSTHPNLVWHFN